jgi:hypothetical protein
VLVPPERTIIVKNRTICPIGHFLAMKRSAHSQKEIESECALLLVTRTPYSTRKYRNGRIALAASD